MDSIEMGKIIRYHRKLSKLSRVDCAELAGIGKTAIYDIEHGKATVRVDTLLKLMSVLNIQLDLKSPLMKKYNDEKS